MRKIFLLMPLLFLVGCGEVNTTTPAREATASVALSKTQGLEDCTLYWFDPGSNKHELAIVRCPNSIVNTTEEYRTNKVTKSQTTVTIDGIEYQPKIIEGNKNQYVE